MLSQTPPFTQEEIREWEEMELQKKKEDRKQYIERGLPINTRHEKWHRMRAEESRRVVASVSQELPAIAGLKSNYLLDSTADSSKAQLMEQDLQGSFITQNPANDNSVDSQNAHGQTNIDVDLRPEYRMRGQDPEPSTIRGQVVNGYSNSDNTNLLQQSPPRDFSMAQGYLKLTPPPAQSSNPEPAKMRNCTYLPGRQSHVRTPSTIPSLDHVEKYTHPITMYSPRSGNWHGLVAKLDSQCIENWISQQIVGRLRLKVLKGTRKLYTTFNGEEVSSDATVKATWSSSKGHGNTHEHIFRVIEKPPFDVLFGTNLLDSDEVKWFGKTPGSDSVLVLTQKKVDEDEQEEIKLVEEIAKKESAMLAKKSQTVKRNSEATTSSRKTSPKPKDPNKELKESKKDSKKGR